MYVFLFCLLFFSLCFKSVSWAYQKDEEEIKDIVSLSQNCFYYITGDYSDRILNVEAQKNMDNQYNKHYFSPWSQSGPSRGLDSLLWPFKWFPYQKTYGENRRLRLYGWYEKQKENAQIEHFGSQNKKVIVVEEANLRAFPSNEPVFFDFEKAGEGYPFDYGQNTTVKPGDPLFVSHLSEDGAWAFVDSHAVSGWIDTRRIAWITEDQIKMWREYPMGVVIKDNLPLLDNEKHFYAKAKIGTILPIVKHFPLQASYEVLIPVRGLDSNVFFKKIILSDCCITPKPLDFTKWNAAYIASQFMHEPYGWGGGNNRRECSATTQDFFAVFGLWLPRNSKAQASQGISVDVKGLPLIEKEKTVLSQGKPFLTLAALPGHIMLYIGTYHDKPVFLHNLWGIRTLVEEKEGRLIIGRTVITSLEAGNELSSIVEKSIIGNRVTHFVVLSD